MWESLCKNTAFVHRAGSSVAERRDFAARGVQHEFKERDWAVAGNAAIPLKGDRSFYADLTQYITLPTITLKPGLRFARHNLEKEAPNGAATEMLDEGLERQDLTALNFVTIDSASTEDM